MTNNYVIGALRDIRGRPEFLKCVEERGETRLSGAKRVVVIAGCALPEDFGKKLVAKWGRGCITERK